MIKCLVCHQLYITSNDPSIILINKPQNRLKIQRMNSVIETNTRHRLSRCSLEDVAGVGMRFVKGCKRKRFIVVCLILQGGWMVSITIQIRSSFKPLYLGVCLEFGYILFLWKYLQGQQTKYIRSGEDLVWHILSTHNSLDKVISYELLVHICVIIV